LTSAFVPADNSNPQVGSQVPAAGPAPGDVPARVQQAAAPKAATPGLAAGGPNPGGGGQPPGFKKTAPKRIGDVLIEEGYITQQQLEQALSEGKATGSPLGAVLIKLGYIDEIKLGKALAKLHGLQYIDTSTIELSPDVMKLIPKDFIKRYMVVPLRIDTKYKRMSSWLVQTTCRCWMKLPC
jgi:type IV pilus assembly protein PilB